MVAPETLNLETDACNTGYGAHFGTRWFKGTWSVAQLARAWRKTRISMPYLEMHALVQAALVWGLEWRGKRIEFRCDCQPTVHAVNTRYSGDSDQQHLLRTLTSHACLHGYDFRAIHIAGITNTIADALSRDDLQKTGEKEPAVREWMRTMDLVATPEAAMPRHS